MSLACAPSGAMERSVRASAGASERARPARSIVGCGATVGVSLTLALLCLTIAIASLPALFLLGMLSAIGVTEHARRSAPLSLFLISYSATLLVLLNFGASLRYVMPHVRAGGAYACHGATHVLSSLCLNFRTGFAADVPALLLTAGALPRSACRAINRHDEQQRQQLHNY